MPGEQWSFPLRKIKIKEFLQGHINRRIGTTGIGSRQRVHLVFLEASLMERGSRCSRVVRGLAPGLGDVPWEVMESYA